MARTEDTPRTSRVLVVARPSTPAGYQVYEIGADYVLGRWRHDLDVEHVQLYPLLKTGWTVTRGVEL